jgi:hypothetical protein
VPGKSGAEIVRTKFLRDGSVLYVSGGAVRSNRGTTRPPHFPSEAWQTIGLGAKRRAIDKAIVDGLYWSDYVPSMPAAVFHAAQLEDDIFETVEEERGGPRWLEHISYMPAPGSCAIMPPPGTEKPAKVGIGVLGECVDSAMVVAMASVDPQWHLFCLEHGLTLDGDVVGIHDGILGRCPNTESPHREKLKTSAPYFNAMVTEQIHPKDKRFSSAKAVIARDAELSDLRDRGTWDESSVREAYLLPVLHSNIIIFISPWCLAS